MTSSVLEYLRGSYEDLETIEKSLSRLLQEKQQSKVASKQVSCDTRIAYLIYEAQRKARIVIEAVEDKDGMKKEEVDTLAGARSNKPAGDVWMNFYDKIKETKDYHRRFGNVGREEVRDPDWYLERATEQDTTESFFSLEEDYGRRVDMHTAYRAFLNLKRLRKCNEASYRETQRARIKNRMKDAGRKLKIADNHPDLVAAMAAYEPMSYIPWLKTFDQFEIPRFCKYRDADYRNYLNEILDYMRDFIRRSSPLLNLDKIEKSCEKEFEERWDLNRVHGWIEKTYKKDLFCQPTQHLFSNKASKESHENGKQYKRKVEQMQKMSPEERKKLVEDCVQEDKSIALLECRIQKLREQIGDQILETIRHCEKKETMTAEELEAEAEVSESESEGGVVVSDIEIDEDEEDRPIYNPLNLPLGWDGKPIPFWLYKLHGLGQEYKCEICGNYSYWGRRSFERHFSEWRHAFGMRCLKIPNTAHFKEITKIADAVTIYDKLKKDAKDQTFDPQADVECEDALGNVMSQKAYDDLKRQGLI